MQPYQGKVARESSYFQEQFKLIDDRLTVSVIIVQVFFLPQY